MAALKLFECKPLHAKITLATCEYNRKKASKRTKMEGEDMGPCKNCTLWQGVEMSAYTPEPKPEYIPKPIPQPEVLHVPFAVRAEGKAEKVKESEPMEEVKQKRIPRRYSEEFKKIAVDELLGGKKWKEVAEKYGISISLLSTWKQKYAQELQENEDNAQSIVDFIQNDNTGNAENDPLSVQVSKIQEDMQEIMLMIRNLAKIAKAVNQAITTL